MSINVKSIKAKSFKSELFTVLTHINKKDIEKIIRSMNVQKICQLKDIPTKIIKINADIFPYFICLHFNLRIDIGEF